MTETELIEHLIWKHGIDKDVAYDVIGPGRGELYEIGDSRYLFGFHDGCHGRVDADQLRIPFHGHKVES